MTWADLWWMPKDHAPRTKRLGSRTPKKEKR